MIVKLHASEYGLPSMKIINSVLRSHTGLIRLYFDAVDQERKYGRSDFDKETGKRRNKMTKMSNHFRMIKIPPSDEPIEYKIDRDYLCRSKADYEENLKKYNAEIEREKD